MIISRIWRLAISARLPIWPRPKQHAQVQDADLTAAKLIHYSKPVLAVAVEHHFRRAVSFRVRGLSTTVAKLPDNSEQNSAAHYFSLSCPNRQWYNVIPDWLPKHQDR